jgi:hypothetical protein
MNINDNIKTIKNNENSRIISLPATSGEVPQGRYFINRMLQLTGIQLTGNPPACAAVFQLRKPARPGNDRWNGKSQDRRYSGFEQYR